MNETLKDISLILIKTVQMKFIYINYYIVLYICDKCKIIMNQ